jgi:hypothetical protein
MDKKKSELSFPLAAILVIIEKITTAAGLIKALLSLFKKKKK